jgi:hypothetical protein
MAKKREPGSKRGSKESSTRVTLPEFTQVYCGVFLLSTRATNKRAARRKIDEAIVGATNERTGHPGGPALFPYDKRLMDVRITLEGLVGLRIRQDSHEQARTSILRSNELLKIGDVMKGLEPS